MQKMLEALAVGVFCVLGLGILIAVIYLAMDTRGML